MVAGLVGVERDSCLEMPRTLEIGLFLLILSVLAITKLIFFAFPPNPFSAWQGATNPTLTTTTTTHWLRSHARIESVPTPKLVDGDAPGLGSPPAAVAVGGVGRAATLPVRDMDPRGRLVQQLRGDTSGHHGPLHVPLL